MEVVGAVSAIAGIASFGLQLAQQLQKQIGEVREAEERVNDLVLELQATSNNLDKIKSLLSSAENTTSQKYALNERFHDDLKFLIRRCEVIFRNIVRLLAKAGSLALSKVDSFLRPFKQNRVSDSNPDLKLEIEFLKLSAGDRSLWSFRRPKIEQYIADLGRLKSELTLLLLIASLTRTVPDGDLNGQASALPEPGDATTLVDEIYYTNQALGNTDKESDNSHTERSMSVNSGDDNSDNDGTSVSGSSSISLLDSTAMQLFKKSAVLFLNWPLSTTDDVPTLELLLEHNIFFEAYAINISGTAYEHTKLPLPNRLLYERALQFSRSTEKSIMDIISELPFAQQKILERTLRQINPKSKSRSSVVQLSGPVVVSLELHNHTRKVTRLHKFRAFFRSQNPEVQVLCMTFTILRFEILNDEEGLDEELELNDENEKVEEQRQERAQAEKKATEEAAKMAAEAVAKEEKKFHAALSAALKSLPPSPDRKEPIQLTDAVGRKFSFPFEVACKWENMEKFIQQAFKDVEDLGPHVSEGHYDLIDSSKRIILPLLWDATVYPGIAIKQMMWPLPQPHRQPPDVPSFSYGPPPPASGVPLRPGQTGRPRPPNHPPPPPPADYIELSRPSHPPSQPPFKQGFTILPNQPSEFAKKRQTRPRKEKLAWMTIPVRPGALKVAPQVTDRIADYKPKAPQKTDLEDKAQEDVVPSDDVKEEVMRHYLKKWTTGSGRNDEQERERARSAESDERRPRTDRRARMSSVESEERTSSVHRRGRESSTHSTKRKSSEHSKDRSPIADSGGEAAQEVQDD